MCFIKPMGDVLQKYQDLLDMPPDKCVFETYMLWQLEKSVRHFYLAHNTYV